jgi:hypothetical protein
VQILLQTVNNFKLQDQIPKSGNWTDASPAMQKKSYDLWLKYNPGLGEDEFAAQEEEEKFSLFTKGWPIFSIVCISVSLVVAFDSLYRQLIQVICLKKDFGSFDVWQRGDERVDLKVNNTLRKDSAKINKLRAERKDSWITVGRELKDRELNAENKQLEKADQKRTADEAKEAKQRAAGEAKEEKQLAAKEVKEAKQRAADEAKEAKQRAAEEAKEAKKKAPIFEQPGRIVTNPMFSEVEGPEATKKKNTPISAFNADAEGFGEDLYDAVDGDELMKCQSNRVTGRDCPGTKVPKSEFCKNHTCGKKRCYKLKSSKAEFCKEHRE